MEFGQRIQIARSCLISKLTSIPETEINRQTKLVYIRQYDSTALKTFIRGLSGNLQSIVRLRNPDSIEMAMNYVTEEENFRYTQNLPNLLHCNIQDKPRSDLKQSNNQPPSHNFSYPRQPQQFYRTKFK